jgi:TPR repeat protein
LSADQGNLLARYNLAVCWVNGFGGGVDEPLAVKLFRQSGEQGFWPAREAYQDCESQGIGASRDKPFLSGWGTDPVYCSHFLHSTLLRLYSCPEASAEYANMYIPYFIQEAERGDLYAPFILGNLFFKGISVPQDKTMAFKYYKLAADRDDAEGLFYCGRCLLDGAGSVAEALEYFRRSADLGFYESFAYLGELLSEWNWRSGRSCRGCKAFQTWC